MAWSLTNRGTATDEFNSNATTTIASFTPGAEKLLVAWISGTCTVSSVSGHGTWTQIDSTAWGSGGAYNFELWACKTSASPSAGTVVFNVGSSWTRQAGCFEVDETVNGLPSAVADCFGTPATPYAAYGNAGPTTLSQTLGAFADSGNLALQIGTEDTAPSGLSVESGWSSIHSVAATLSTNAGYLASEDTSPAMTTSSSYLYLAALAVEIKMATASGGAGARAINHNGFDIMKIGGTTG